MRFDIARFFVFLIILYGIFYVLPLDPFQGLMASLSGYGLSFLGVDARVVDNSIFTAYGEFTITKDCLGVISLATLISLLFSTRGIRTRYGVLFSALGAVLFFVWNAVRIVISVGFGKSNFEVWHFTLWVVSILLIIGVYYLAIKASEVERVRRA